MMSDKDIMLRIPEVAYLVDRIPIARVAIKPNAVHLRFLQHARDTKMPLREQCEALDIPWHARKVPADLVSKKMLKVSRSLSASVFAQTFRFQKEEEKRWVPWMMRGIEYPLPAHSLRWLAYHATELSFDGDYTIFRYLREVKSIKSNVSLKTVKERSRERGEQNRPILGMWCEDGSLIIRDPFIGINEGRVAVTDRMPIEYHPVLIEPLQLENLIVSLCYKPEHFKDAGEKLHNCICDTGYEEASFMFQTKINYFSRAKRGRCHIAVVNDGDMPVAAAEFDPNWNITSVKAANNKDVTNPDILVAVNKFSELAQSLAPDEKEGGV